MGKSTPFRLILASASAARRDLLSRAGYHFDVMPANIAEPSSAGFTVVRPYVQNVAWLKAAAVAASISADQSGGPAIILAADTVGWLEGQAIGKPTDENDARRILRRLAGTEHELWTGVCLWHRPGDLQIAWQEMSRVAMKPMTEAQLDEYFRTRVWEGCSGGYAIQEGDDPYVRVLQGSISNVIGLPMETLTEVLYGLVKFPTRNPGQ
jgi:septum formation protein